ncbi:MAG: hypothetical protein K2K34_02570 [Oscillospiraceae bacterium]|nr:hypothetical protein [Oscillospiraceae bacterium]
MPYFRRGAVFAATASLTALLAFSACGGKSGILTKTPDLNVPFENDIIFQAG